MLTPLPSPTPPSPSLPGVHSLPLPHGAASSRQGTSPLPDLPPGVPRPGAPAPSQTPTMATTVAPLPRAASEQRLAETLLKAATGTADAMAGTLPDAARGSAATPMSLVAAQMLGVDTTALQSLLAQQAATRALPGSRRRAEPHHDDPPAALLAAPDDGFDPHAPHPQPGPAGAQGPSPPSEGEITETTLQKAAPPRKDGKPAQAEDSDPVGRSDLAAPAPFAALALHPTVWTLAGAAFTGIFVVTLLMI